MHTFRINNTAASTGCLQQLRILLLEDGEILLGFPVPDGVGSEDEVHFFEGALVGFRVESPDYDYGGGVDGTEEVEGLFVEFGEDGWEEEHLISSMNKFRKLEKFRGMMRILTVQPLPMDQPTTPHALPLARTSSGNISAG